MTVASYLPQIAQLIMGIVGGGVLGTWLTHKRLGPKSTAEARQITAAAIDKDWARFEREIDRLVKRVEQAEDDASAAKLATQECERREIALQARIAMLEAVNEGRGQIRQRAQEVISADRASEASRREV